MANLIAVPKNWFSWDYLITDETREVAEINLSYGNRESRILVDNSPYKVFRKGLAHGAYLLQDERGMDTARAEKPSAFSRSFIVEHKDRRMVLEAVSAFGRAFVLTEGNAEVGSVRPENFFCRRATASLPEELPLPVKVFLIWLVIILWRRNADSEGSTA